jgi:hypothetical protein
MNDTIAKLIIESCRNDFLFEQFAIQICSKEHGIEFLPTSQSWDRGRDGRSAGKSKGSHRNILCATLNRDINAKVEADLLRVTATSSPDHLIYCSSQYLSEEKIDEITKIIKRHAPSGSLTTYGSLQLAHLAGKFEDIFEKNFHGEIESIRGVLRQDEDRDGEDRQRRSLRLALLTAGQSSGADLRQDLLERVALECLTKNASLTAEQIAQTFSEDLGLPRQVRAEMLKGVLEKLYHKNLVSKTADKWHLTDKGEEYISSLEPAVADSVIKGRAAIRERVEQLIGKKLAETQHERIWSTLLDFLSALFYQKGLEIIHAFETFLKRQDQETTADSLQAMLRDGAHRVAIASASFPDDQVLIETAIMDLLTEREGDAFEWLIATCERFVIMCCLGIEANSAAEIQKVLTEGGIVPDTDILLTYLCPHASDYSPVRDLLRRWMSLGGKILVAPVVLEEVAYHAWISATDFRETRHLLGKLQGIDRYRYLRNAFVREFHALDAPEGQWDLFISQYRGNSSEDYTKIRNLLATKLRSGIVPDSFDEELAHNITFYLMEQTQRLAASEQEAVDEDREFKINRDGRLLSSIAVFRKQEASLSSKAPVTILSSSSALRRASVRFTEAFSGDTQVVFTRGSFAYLLSMVPEAQLGADSLRRALFEFGRTGKLQDTDRRALRIIKSAGNYDIPWAERPLLASQLKRSIQEEANRLGVKTERIKQTIKTGQQPDTVARVIVDALSRLSEDPKEVEKLKAAERRIIELETQLDELHSALQRSKTAK